MVSNTVTAPDGITSRSNVITLMPTNATTGLLEANAVDGSTIHTRVNASPTVTTLNATTVSATTISGNGLSVTNVQSTNVVGSTGVLAPTSNQTNYTVPLLTGSANDTLIIYTASTNAFITFTGTNLPFAQRTVLFHSLTSSVACKIGFISEVKTNLNFVNWATNGTFKFLSFFNPDAAGTNVQVLDGGTQRGGFTQ